ncbi:MAG: hypothetical protein QOJ31_392 [Gaiellales bacterium]|nr:hypothetical protein [Gaiellales bacterium]
MSRHSAKLAERGSFDSDSRVLTATLDRSEIEAARSGDGQAELTLEVTRGVGAESSANTLEVAWSAEDLEALLRADPGETLTIAIDQKAIEAALESEGDVEAHGLRQKALLFTVIVASSAAVPTIASAHPAGAPGGTTGSNVAPAVLVGGAATPTATPTFVQNAAITVGGAESAQAQAASAADTVATVAPAVLVGGAGNPVVTPAAVQSAAITVGGAESAQAQAEAASAAQAVAAESPALMVGGAIPVAQETSPAAMVGGGSFNSPDATSPAAMVGGGAIAPSTGGVQQASAASTGGGSSVFDNAPDATTIATGAALAITAAGFAAAAAGNRRRPPRPA